MEKTFLTISLFVLSMSTYAGLPSKSKETIIKNPKIKILDRSYDDGEIWEYEISGKALRFKRKFLKRYYTDRFVMREVRDSISTNVGSFTDILNKNGETVGYYELYKREGSIIARYKFIDNIHKIYQLKIGEIIKTKDSEYIKLLNDKFFSCIYTHIIGGSYYSDAWYDRAEIIHCHLHEKFIPKSVNL